MAAWHKRRRIDNPDELLSELALSTALREDLNYSEVHLSRDALVTIATAKLTAKPPGIALVHYKTKGYVPGKSVSAMLDRTRQDWDLF